MATTTFADLESRIRGIDARTTRNEEDITVIIESVSENLTRTRRIERRLDRVEHVLEAIATHLGVTVPPLEADEGDEDE